MSAQALVTVGWSAATLVMSWVPAGEAAVDGLVGWEVVGQVVPRYAGAVDVEDGGHQGA